jgi:hypothetical protein
VGQYRGANRKSERRAGPGAQPLRTRHPQNVKRSQGLPYASKAVRWGMCRPKIWPRPLGDQDLKGQVWCSQGQGDLV